MDDIKKLRDLLSKCDNSLGFSKYDARINAFYVEKFKLEISKFNYDKSKFKLKENIKSNEYDLVSEYIFKLNKLKDKCNSIVKNNIDLSNLNIASSLYKDGVLLLDSINNIDYLLELLNSFNNISKIYQNVDLNKDFEVLSFNTIIDGKNIKIKNKSKYEKMSKDDIIKDALKPYHQYYISEESLSVSLALMHKKNTKKNIHTKIAVSIFKFILADILPVILLLICSIFALNKFKLTLPEFDFSGFNFTPVVIVLGMIVIGIVAICLEVFICKNLLNRLPIVTGSKSFLLCLSACIINYVVFALKMEFSIINLIISIFACLDAIFFGFFAGPNFRHEKEINFSLLGRLLISLTSMDMMFLFLEAIPSNIAKIIVIVLLTFSAGIAIEYKVISKSPFYGKNDLSKEEKK